MAATKKTAVKTVKKTVEVKTVKQLNDDLVAKTNEMVEAKKGHRMGELTNPRFLTVTRKEIARIKTAIRAAELAEHKENK